MNRKNKFIIFSILCLSVILVGCFKKSDKFDKPDTSVNVGVNEKNSITWMVERGYNKTLTNIENFSETAYCPTVTFTKDGKNYTVHSFYTYIENN